MQSKRELIQRRIEIKQEILRRRLRERHAAPGGLFEFVKHFWHVLEPKTQFVDGWAIRAICGHLEAVASGKINRLLVNVPPGFSKSLLCNCFFPAWLWGPLNRPETRIIGFSYASHLTERDNGKFRDLICSRSYKDIYGEVFESTAVGVVKIANNKTGWKFASSVQGVGTGERSDIVVLDDPHNIADGESDVIRKKTVTWFDEAMSNRLNDLQKSAIIVIMQRVHQDDVSGHILTHEDEYHHLLIPMEWDGRRYETCIGWTDPRSEMGELAWPERFSDVGLTKFKRNKFMWAGQYQQMPQPRGGGMFKEDYWSYEPVPIGKSPPPCDYIIASLDSAYTKQERNDPSGFTAWGVYRDSNGNPKILLLGAWRKHLEIHGTEPERKKGEPEYLWKDRCKKEWGLIEWVAHDCRRLRVDRLLIEAKASGLSVAQEMERLYKNEGWGVELCEPDGDKYARAVAVVHLWADGIVHVPVWPDEKKIAGVLRHELGREPTEAEKSKEIEQALQNNDVEVRDWADLVVQEMAVFPNGKFKDLTDSSTQALKHLRAVGMAIRRDEREWERIHKAQHKERYRPLYQT